jgi:hypothetical protein
MSLILTGFFGFSIILIVFMLILRIIISKPEEKIQYKFSDIRRIIMAIVMIHLFLQVVFGSQYPLYIPISFN